MRKIFFLLTFFSFVSSFDLNCWHLIKVVNNTDEIVTIGVLKDGSYMTESTLCRKSETLLDYQFPCFPEDEIFEKDGTLAIKSYLKIFVRDCGVFIFFEKDEGSTRSGVYFYDKAQEKGTPFRLCDSRKEGNLIISKNREGRIKFNIK